MKSEPEVFSILDLKNATHQTTMWEGVRNYEARNFMRDHMKLGDGVLFYHSNDKPPHIAGTAFVDSVSYPDPTQFDAYSDYYDPKATIEQPIWYLVDIKFERLFNKPVERHRLLDDPICFEMMLFKRNRLSITPVSSEEWMAIHQMAQGKPKR